MDDYYASCWIELRPGRNTISIFGSVGGEGNAVCGTFEIFWSQCVRLLVISDGIQPEIKTSNDIILGLLLCFLSQPYTIVGYFCPHLTLPPLRHYLYVHLSPSYPSVSYYTSSIRHSCSSFTFRRYFLYHSRFLRLFNL